MTKLLIDKQLAFTNIIRNLTFDEFKLDTKKVRQKHNLEPNDFYALRDFFHQFQDRFEIRLSITFKDKVDEEKFNVLFDKAIEKAHPKVKDTFLHS